MAMWCKACRTSWPGHKTCPTCGKPLTDMKKVLAEVQIEDLPLLHDLAHQFEQGRREAERQRDPDDADP